jgi:hypothetical protein
MAAACQRFNLDKDLGGSVAHVLVVYNRAASRSGRNRRMSLPQKLGDTLR